MARVECESGGAPTARLRATSGARPRAMPVRNESAAAPSARGCLQNRSAIHSTTKRSEEHTSELQSLAYLVCRLLLEKKKTLAARREDSASSKPEQHIFAS